MQASIIRRVLLQSIKNVFTASLELNNMPEEWSPSEDQKEGAIYRSYELIHAEIDRLRDEINCPDEFIYDFLETIRDHYSPTSGFAKIRQNKGLI